MAAAKLDVEVGQIVKSLVFLRGDEPGVVLCAGDRRVDGKRLGLTRARADLSHFLDTGHHRFSVGGIPPVGHLVELPTTIDESLRRLDVVWAAACTPTTCSPLAPRR